MSATCGVGWHPWRKWAAAEHTVSALLRHVAERRPEDVVLTIGDTTYTARGLMEAAAAAAACLRNHGVRAGDRVAVMSPNRRELVEVFLGCAWNASVFVPLNPALRGEPLRHQLSLADPALVVFDRATAEQLQQAFDVFGDVPPGRLFIDTEPLDGYPTESGAPDHPVEHPVFAPDPTGDAAAAPVGPDDTAAIMFTSGTTGPAKGVVVPHGQLWWWALIGSEQLGLRSDDVLYTCLPLYHTNALTTLLQALAADARAVIGPKFSVSAFWSRLVDAEATTTFVLGAMATMLWNRRPEPFDRGAQVRMRRILGPGIDPRIKPDFEDYFGVRVVEGFGMTEVGVPLYTSSDERTVGVLGTAHPDYEVVVLDAADCIVPDGTVGELAVRPRQPHLLSVGYFRQPEATAESRRNLWFHSGDLVSRDVSGVFRYFDRAKDAIRRRGENISGYEVEAAFLRHPAVAAAAAYAVPSVLGEDEVMVSVELQPGAPFDPESLIEFVQRDLPPFAVPQYLRSVAALPLTANGKVSKHVLKEQGVTADTWERR